MAQPKLTRSGQAAGKQATRERPLFRYHEGRWYRFGLKLGLMNALRNGTALGPKRTLGKILQPIDNYMRFPEYDFMGRSIGEELTRKAGPSGMIQVLDVGSPKNLGLYLGFHYNAEIWCTDISTKNLDHYAVMWQAIQAQAKGRTQFDQQDVRSLSYADSAFDVVFAMSVIEHVEGELQDAVAVKEMIRVLKPDGLLLLSTPVGPAYIEQSIRGRAHGVDEMHDDRLYFFQRIYDLQALETRLLPHLRAHCAELRFRTVFRWNTLFTKIYHSLRGWWGLDINGLLGFLNPLLSAILNRHQEGMTGDFFTRYSRIHTQRDIYGDLIVVGRKAAAR